MDASQYHPNAMNNPNPYGGSLPNISPHQLSNSNLPPHTLPPLQATQHASMQSLYGSGGSGTHTPRTPATPGTPTSANNMGNFPQMGLPGQTRGYPNMMPAGAYQQQHQQQHQQPPPQGYRVSSAMMPQTTTAMSHPQPIAPAPAQNRMPQTLRPMPPNGLQHLGGMQGGYAQSAFMPADIDPPTHVVGSQGRRGILPSAPGRPAVPATGAGATKNTMIPAKDADGKFPCPHCTKTYLHAKHLKRHLLRHTGDRPYMCVLCRDTFSRSDILKRHFQKCSIRRGNPTGASHLSHAQAHLKKSHPGPHKNAPSMSNENDLMGMNGMSNLSNDPAMHPFGVIPDGSVPDANSNLTDEQAEHMARNEGMKRMNVGGGGRDVRSMTGPGPGGSNRAGFDHQNYAGGIASSMPSGMNPSLAFNMPNGQQNGHSYNQGYDLASHGNGTHVQTSGPQSRGGGGSGGSLNWQQMYQPNGTNGFMGQYNPNLNLQLPIKNEGAVNNAPNHNPLLTSMYPGSQNPSAVNGGLSLHWNTQSDLMDLSNRLQGYCFPNNQITHSSAHEIRRYLSPENVGDFLEHFNNFQVHFPVIHFPSFQKNEVYDGLTLSVICIGAVYSDRITPTQVREMMDFAKTVIERNSRVLAIVSSREPTNEAIGTTSREIEDIIAFFMMHVLFTWHGTPLQREQARRQFPILVEMVRRARLTRPMTNPPYSLLHQSQVTAENVTASSFDWNAWVEQEKRSRLLFAVYLIDTSMVVYFNSSPILDPLEIQIPLPADDAAWEARTSSDCASALGLHGPGAAQNRNPHGSRRMKQPEMHTALRTLMHPTFNMQSGSTNVYSKFILMHSLHVQLWTAQKQLSQDSSQMIPHSLAFPSSGTSTPISQHDWVTRGGMDPTGSGPQSANNSGRATPIEGVGQAAHLLRATTNALEKWKKAWDEDMMLQYPPTSNPPRRVGFCRDAVHFYWLARRLLTNSHGHDVPPDKRFTFVMHMLKSAREWAVSDSHQRGEELGSICEIDNYGVTDLTLDMAQLFTPINSHHNSPTNDVHIKYQAH